MKRILIIDDEQDLCMLLKSYLAQKHHEVFVAYRLKEGLEKATEIKPDILFLDNNLPDGHGWEQADALKKEFPMMDIILMSAYKSAPRNMEQPSRVHVLEKPVSFSTLDNALQSMG